MIKGSQQKPKAARKSIEEASVVTDEEYLPC